MEALRQCPGCDTRFEATHPNQRWCVPRCGARYRMRKSRRIQRKMVPDAKTYREAARRVRELESSEYSNNTRTCIECGSTLAYKRHSAVFCGAKCRMRWTRRETSEGVLFLSSRQRRKLAESIRRHHGAVLRENQTPLYVKKSFRVIDRERFKGIASGDVSQLRTSELTDLVKVYPGALMALGLDF